jgi:hypothetical protein
VISFTTVLGGIAQDIAAPECSVGTVGGTVENVNGAIIPKAELALECPLPCRRKRRSQAIQPGLIS